MERKLLAATDLGGTKIYTVVAEKGGPVLARVRLDTRAQDGPAAVMEQIALSVEQAVFHAGADKGQLAAVGICLAGFFDWQSRLMIHSPNLEGWNGIAVEKRLSDRLGVPVLAENDANAAALGEARHGAGAGSRDLVFITVSTGIGAGLIQNGQLYRGTRGFAGEAGHMVIKPDGPLCGCGRRGCLETVASGTAIARLAREAIQAEKQTVLKQYAQPVSASDVFAAARAGDAVATAILDEAMLYLGLGLVNLVNLLNPEVIVLGGGVAEAGEQLLAPLASIIARHAVAPAAQAVTLRKAALGVEAGVIGMLTLLEDFPGKKEG
jgi:glucokinase